MRKIFFLNKPAIILAILLLPFSCSKSLQEDRDTGANESLKIKLIQNSPASFSLVSLNDEGKVRSTWDLPYPVYNVTTADVNDDGKTEVLAGVIKKTRYDSLERRRLFIFKLVDGCIRPMWLGSRVSQPLVDFACVKKNGKTFVRTLEREKDGSLLVGEYRWKGFGLEWMRYLYRNLDDETAKQKLTIP